MRHVDRQITIYDFVSVDQLLIGWQGHVARQQMIHEEAARRLSWAHYALGVPAAVLAAFAGTAAVAGTQATLEMWSVAGAVLATASSIMAGLQTLLNLGGRTESHRRSATAYKRLVRELERIAPSKERLVDLSNDSELCTRINKLERQIADADSQSILPPRSVARLFANSTLRVRDVCDVVVDAREPVGGSTRPGSRRTNRGWCRRVSISAGRT
jgi:hypothetical protein